MKTENKGGRPAKVAGQKKGYTLKAKAREAGISISECVRQSVLRGVIKQRLNTEMYDLIRKLCGMANNLNQIAHLANATGTITEDQWKETHQLLEKIWDFCAYEL